MIDLDESRKMFHELIFSFQSLPNGAEREAHLNGLITMGAGMNIIFDLAAQVLDTALPGRQFTKADCMGFICLCLQAAAENQGDDIPANAEVFFKSVLNAMRLTAEQNDELERRLRLAN